MFRCCWCTTDRYYIGCPVTVTPAGKPLKVAPVAPVVAKVIFVSAVLIHLVWLFVPAPDDNVIVLFAVTVIFL